MTKHDKRAPRIFAAAITGLCAAACGDDGQPQASDTAGGTSTTGLTTTMTVPTSSATDTVDDSMTTSVSGVSESATMATAVPTESTESTVSDTTSLSGDTSATDTADTTDTTDTTSGGTTPFCGEEPPKGFVGPFDATCKTEPQIGTFTPVAPFEPLRDVQWAAIVTLVDGDRPRGGKPVDLRLVVDGIRWVLHTQAHWSDIPASYASSTTCWRWYKRWCADGTCPKVEALLAAPVARSARRPTPRALPPAPESRTRQKPRGPAPGCFTAP